VSRVNLSDCKKQKKILLLEGIHPKAQERLVDAGYLVDVDKAALQDKELIKKAQGYNVLGIRSKTKLTSSVIKELPELELIGCFCIGTDQVDLVTARELGVPTFNAPYANTRSVAELIIAEIIALSRNLADRSMQMHRGVWRKSAMGANEVRGKTLGIVGYGHIGSQVSVLAEALGLKVRFFDIVKKLPLGNAQVSPSLEDLLKNSDFVTLHVPDTQQTKNMITKNELSLMKKGAYLLNASRGQVVDIKALSEALRTQHIGGAAIDVYPAEPDGNSDEFKSELQELENVILTPHIGGSTEEAQEAIGLEVADSFIRHLKWGNTAGAVNFPQIEVGDPNGYTRIINVHYNVPGVLGAINGIFSAEKVNVVAQHLATDAKIGYLIMDIEVKDTFKVAKAISELKTSIRTSYI
jgi:D-3-phosphoglycerate dehydrogenase